MALPIARPCRSQSEMEVNVRATEGAEQLMAVTLTYVSVARKLVWIEIADMSRRRFDQEVKLILALCRQHLRCNAPSSQDPEKGCVIVRRHP